MKATIDLNADMGEGFGPWRMGDDAALLDLVSSANVACGFHAGDAATMARVMADAAARGVGIGAHPGLPDKQGFGRRNMALSPDEARAMVAYQLGAARGMAASVGAELRHLKLHGALANMAARDEALARACFQGALSVDPDIILLVMAGTAQARAAQALGARSAQEIFADRAYLPDGLLMPRGQKGAVLHDPQEISDRVLAMLEAGAVIAHDGTPVDLAMDSICLHGDTEAAVGIARHLRAALEQAGVRVRAFDGGRG